MLIEFAPGATLVHRHHYLEGGIVLRGSLQIGELKLGQGDYHVSPPGSRRACIYLVAGAHAWERRPISILVTQPMTGSISLPFSVTKISEQPGFDSMTAFPSASVAVRLMTAKLRMDW